MNAASSKFFIYILPTSIGILFEYLAPCGTLKNASFQSRRKVSQM